MNADLLRSRVVKSTRIALDEGLCTSTAVSTTQHAPEERDTDREHWQG